MSESTRTRVPASESTNGATGGLTAADLAIKTQVAISMPVGLLFQIEKTVTDKDKNGKPIVGAALLKIIADHFNYTLSPSKRNRSSMSEEEKKEKAKAAAAERANKLKSVMEQFRNAEAS